MTHSIVLFHFSLAVAREVTFSLCIASTNVIHHCLQVILDEDIDEDTIHLLVRIFEMFVTPNRDIYSVE